VKAHHAHLFEQVRSEQHDLPVTTVAPIDVAALVRRWLATGPELATQREDLEALCRQIDVRRRISAAYGARWQRLASEQPADPRVVSGLVAMLLASGAAALADDAGWSLKCVNSALKALDLCPDAPHRPALRTWACDILDFFRHLDSRR
jgi:hypothetical protein